MRYFDKTLTSYSENNHFKNNFKSPDVPQGFEFLGPQKRASSFTPLKALPIYIFISISYLEDALFSHR